MGVGAAAGSALDDGGDDIKALLKLIAAGDLARDQLFKLVYPELKKIARNQMANEFNDLTLEALAIEVFLRLSPSDAANIKDRADFLAIAANVMRRILVGHPQGRLSRKRGSGKRAQDENVAFDLQRPEAMMDLVRALSKLEEMNPRQARVVEMRFFGGFNEQQIGEVLSVNSRTVKRDWQMARAWLLGELNQENESAQDGAAGVLAAPKPTARKGVQ